MITDILVEKGILKKEDVKTLMDESISSNISLERVLLKHGVDPKQILEAKGEYLAVPTKSLEGVDIPTSALDLIPEESARHYKLIPIDVDQGVLYVGMVDPDDISARDALNFIASKLNMPFKLFLVSEPDFEKAIALYKGLSGEVNKALSELEVELKIEGDKVTAASKDKKKDGSDNENLMPVRFGARLAPVD